MPTLSQTLPINDLGFLRIVASLWGIELSSADPSEAAVELAETLCDAELLEEVISSLPEQGQAALGALADEGGRMTWVNFTRRFGDVREMGAGRRDREQPHQRPNSTAEMLWYRALVSKSFFETAKGPQEFAFIPDDLREALGFIGFTSDQETEEEEEDNEEEEENDVDEGAKPVAPEETPDEEPTIPVVRAMPLKRPASASPLKTSEKTPEPERHTPTPLLPRPTVTPVERSRSDPKPTPSIHRAEPTRIPMEPPAPEEGRIAPTPSGPGRGIVSDEIFGRPASPTEKSIPSPASDRLLDDACTFLAALRMGLEPPPMRTPAKLMRELLTTAGLLADDLPKPEPLKQFLESPRKEALQSIVSAWRGSDTFNELRLVPGITCEGGWQNQAHETRQTMFGFINQIPMGQWWSIAALLRDIKARAADFQRPAGDYDSWFIRRTTDGAFLRGFASWDEVDGALLRYFILILYWLGQLDLASAEEDGQPTALRRIPALEQKEEKGRLIVSSSGRVVVERLAPRAARYQVARFSDWEHSPSPEEYRYRVTSQSLKRAAEQGLKAGHLLSLLGKHSGGLVPPALVKMLQRWESSGTEARVQTITVLRVSRPEVLDEIRKSKAARFLGEIIGPTTIAIQPEAAPKVLAALAELGLLADEE